jgi:hypothetical protein
MPSSGHIAPVIQPSTPAIRYLRRREIDIRRWDDCILSSVNPLIYGRSFYLDEMAARNWDALVLDDYMAVMPLTWRSKAGIRYLYQPAFTQQTGIFSAQPISPSMVETFLAVLARYFRFAEIYLNYSNAHSTLSPRANFVLHLDASYEQLAGQYKKDLIRNLKLSSSSPLTYKKDFNLHTALLDFRREYSSHLPAIKEDDYRRFETLSVFLKEQDQLLTRAVLDERQQPLSSAVFLRDTRRFYLIHSTTLPAGRASEANHFLLDQFIREWAGSSMILDFEGSDHPGIAHFYSNFGAIDQPYFFHRRNRLPWPIRWLK